MPRTQRWNTIHGTFRSGQLSPAAQDDISADVWQQGAARLRNFRVQRDGGLETRPALRRTGLVVPIPRRGLLAGGHIAPTAASIFSNSRILTGLQVPLDFYSVASRYGAPYGKDGGVLWLGDESTPRTFATTTATPPHTPLLRVVFPERVSPSAITFHGVHLLPGFDRTYTEGSITRLNLAVWLGTADPGGSPFDPTQGKWAAFDTGIADVEDPFTPGAFAPGLIRRDLVIPLDANPEVGPDGNVVTERTPIYYVDVRVQANQPAGIGIDGVSCFGDAGGVELPAGVHDRPYRIIPWPIRSQPFALLLGMDYAAWIQLPTEPGADPVRRAFGTAVWHFTARQLRELTWARLGGDLLLVHHEFPFPLRVVLPTDAERLLRILPLRLINIPFIPREAQDRVQPDVSTIGDELELAPIRPTDERPVPLAPTAMERVSLSDTSIVMQWTDTGADSYSVEYGLEHPPGSPTQIDTAGAPLFALVGLRPGQIYRVRLRAHVGTDTSEWTPWWTMETTREAPAIPGVVTLTSPAVAMDGTTPRDGFLRASWTAVPAADRYQVAVAPEGDAFVLRGEPVERPTLVLIAAAGSRYRVRVRTLQLPIRTAGGRHYSRPSAGPWSAIAEIVGRAVPPAKVENLTATRITNVNGGIRLAWDPAARAETYEIQYRLFTTRTGTMRSA